MISLRNILSEFVDILFNDASDTPRTIITGFVTGVVSGSLIWTTVSNGATLFMYGVVGGIASMIGKEIYSIIRKKLTNEKTN